MSDLPNIDNNIVDDRHHRHEVSPNSIVVDHFASGIGQVLHKETQRASAYALADAFHAAYANEVELHPSASREMATWWREFFTSGEAAKLRAKTQGNQAMSEAAAMELAIETKRYHESFNNDDDIGTSNESVQSMISRMRSLKRATANATSCTEQLEALGQDLSAGCGGKYDRQKLQDAIRKLSRSLKLRRIMELAGALHLVRSRSKKKRETDGPENVVGVINSNDISRLLPSELGKLGCPSLRPDFLRRFVERQTLALDKRSMENAGKGPVVVLVDGSSSMEYNDRICEAKAFALVMARIAQQQKRYVVLIEFSGTDEIKEIVLEPKNWDPSALLQWLEHFFNGGTCFTCLDYVVDNWSKWNCPKGKTDIFIATDINATIEDSTVKKFAEFRTRERVRSYGLAISADTGDLDLICDQSWTTHSMGVQSHEVREILSEA